MCIHCLPGWISFLILFTFPDLLQADPLQCNVTVQSDPRVYSCVPQNSFVIVNCQKANLTEDTLLKWTVRLPGSDSFINLLELNNQNFTECTQRNSSLASTILSVISPVNGTTVRCRTLKSGKTTTVTETTFIIFDPTPVMNLSINSGESTESSIVISWSPLQTCAPVGFDTNESYFLTVSSKYCDLRCQSVQLYEPHFEFTAPDGAPSCEVYNFSVTATYDGARYTGPGCIEPSSIQSMLPSLPDTKRLESLLKYSLMKRIMLVTLNVSINPPEYCEQYPVQNYLLKVTGPSTEAYEQSISATNLENIIIENLNIDTKYSFMLLIVNTVGNVSSKSRQFYTTDVQRVTATAIEGMNGFQVHCEFIAGSDARGCMVVLVGEHDNLTSILDRNEDSKFLTSTIPLSCYHEVFAFDIESDGMNGTLAIPGVLVKNFSFQTTCQITRLPNWVIGIMISFSLFVLASATVAVVTMVSCKRMCKLKRKPSFSPSQSSGDTPVSFNDKQLENYGAEVLYAQPVTVATTSGEDAKYHEKTKHITHKSVSVETAAQSSAYAEIAPEGHLYHTLESSRDLYTSALLELSEPLPVYQEITELYTSPSNKLTRRA